jgi:hypothetical protein
MDVEPRETMGLIVPSVYHDVPVASAVVTTSDVTHSHTASVHPPPKKACLQMIVVQHRVEALDGEHQ